MLDLVGNPDSHAETHFFLFHQQMQKEMTCYILAIHFLLKIENSPRKMNIVLNESHSLRRRSDSEKHSHSIFIHEILFIFSGL